MSAVDYDPEYRQGEWEHVTSILPTVDEVLNACNRFWNKCEIDHFVYDNDGKIIDVVRTNVQRVRPIKKEHWVRGVSAKKNNKT